MELQKRVVVIVTRKPHEGVVKWVSKNKQQEILIQSQASTRSTASKRTVNGNEKSVGSKPQKKRKKKKVEKAKNVGRWGNRTPHRGK